MIVRNFKNEIEKNREVFLLREERMQLLSKIRAEEEKLQDLIPKKKEEPVLK